MRRLLVLSRALAIGAAFSVAARGPRSARHLAQWDVALQSQGQPQRLGFRSAAALHAKPKRGGVVDSYQTVSVNCAKCGTRLFRYKKKNGTKSNLVKCFIERIAEDSAGVLQSRKQSDSAADAPWACPNCDTQFARSATIRGLPALKMVGGKIRMTKK